MACPLRNRRGLVTYLLPSRPTDYLIKIAIIITDVHIMRHWHLQHLVQLLSLNLLAMPMRLGGGLAIC